MSGRILIVDDVATNRIILNAKLSLNYFDVIQAESGADALQGARTMAPDLILLDVMMPDMDGFGVCARLKADPATADIPVIMVTALAQAADRRRGLEVGADDFLSKPVTDLELFARIRHLLRVKRMMDSLRLRDVLDEESATPLPAFEPPPLYPSKCRVFLAGTEPELGARVAKAAAQIGAQIAVEGCADRAECAQVHVIDARGAERGEALRAVSHLRGAPDTRLTEILLVIARGDRETAARGLDLGASDYVFDPVDAEELSLRMMAQMKRNHLSRQLRLRLRRGLCDAAADPLTGLANRRAGLAQLARMAANAHSGGPGVSVVLIDIDHFKVVNDTHGHAAGDRVLCGIAGILRDNLRPGDLAARIGGEEFLVAMPETPVERAVHIAERLRTAIQQHRVEISQGATVGVTASFGVVASDTAPQDAEAMIAAADGALYAAKARGRNHVSFARSAA